MTGDFPEGVLRLLAEFNARHVKYMVVGMSSAIMQGVPGTTQDIDLWFEEFSSPAVDEAVRAVGGMVAWRACPPVITGSDDLDVVDVVYHCGGMRPFGEEYRDAVVAVHEPSGVEVPLLPLERVLVSKVAAGRKKDRAAVVVIEDFLGLRGALEKGRP